MPQYRDNPELWRERAEEARVQAEQMSDPEVRERMLQIARGYDRLAAQAEQRLAAAKQALSGNAQTISRPKPS